MVLHHNPARVETTAPHTNGFRTNGFSLPEIIIVCAIAALLAAILLPAISRTRDMARTTSCKSNLRQLGMAMEQYLDDYEQRYPIQDQTPGNEYTFANSLHAHVKNAQILLCPAVPQQVTEVEPPTTDPSDYRWRFGGVTGAYSLNGMLQNLKLSQVRQPVLTVLFTDSRSCGDIGYNSHLQHSARHHDGLNVTFADGHIKWVQKTQGQALNFFP